MKSLGKYALIALIAFAVGALASSKWFDNREPEITVERDTIYLPQTDTTGLQFATQDKVEVAPVVMTLPAGFTTPEGEVLTDSIEVSTQKYTGKEELDNGTIHYQIYANKLLAYEFTLDTEDRIIRETITKLLPSKSRLFLTGGVDMNWVNKTPQAAALGLMYNRRQKWGVGAEVRHDFSGLLPPENATTVGLRVYIGL